MKRSDTAQMATVMADGVPEVTGGRNARKPRKVQSHARRNHKEHTEKEGRCDCIAGVLGGAKEGTMGSNLAGYRTTIRNCLAASTDVATWTDAMLDEGLRHALLEFTVAAPPVESTVTVTTAGRIQDLAFRSLTCTSSRRSAGRGPTAARPSGHVYGAGLARAV